MSKSEPSAVAGESAFQILTTRFSVAAVGARARRALRFLPADADHEVTPLRHRKIVIAHRDGCYDITFDDRPPHREYDAAYAMEWLHQYLTDTALEDHGRGVALSAGSAVVGGRRVLFAGGGRVARTRLALRLLFDGHDVESDRYSLIDGDGGSGLNFRFALTENRLSAIPELQSVPPSVPSVIDEGDHKTYLFSPVDFGFASPVAWGPVAAIFMLDVNMGGDTRVAPARRPELLEALVSECAAWRPADGDWVGTLTSAVARAATYRLFLGDIGAAGRLVAAKAAAQQAMEAADA